MNGASVRKNFGDNRRQTYDRQAFRHVWRFRWSLGGGFGSRTPGGCWKIPVMRHYPTGRAPQLNGQLFEIFCWISILLAVALLPAAHEEESGHHQGKNSQNTE
jgi:hypothetical protein